MSRGSIVPYSVPIGDAFLHGRHGWCQDWHDGMDLTDSCRLFSVWRESKEDGGCSPILPFERTVQYDHDRRGRVPYRRAISRTAVTYGTVSSKYRSTVRSTVPLDPINGIHQDIQSNGQDQ